ncbi:carnitine acetyl transferase [Exidia glandulosa HHB12029]|uniref:Carnitine acetyl transferase n=1 Tax=Exidia glandulosa HHB12029 TaxID=1314781 RepID=A0A165NTX8_EXIGL|nr:carnitine acetyl transferase [Exidia glandulosa HHB12029]
MLGTAQLQPVCRRLGGARLLHKQRFRPMITTTDNERRPPHPQWKAQAPFPPQGTVTYAHQSNLPRLPILPLQPTLEKLKTSLKPLAWSEEEFQATAKKIDDFGASSAIGETLQSRLEEWGKDKDHWLEEWWDDIGYLKYRDSVVVNVSYYYGFTPHPAHLPQTPAHRAAALTRATLLFRSKLKQGLLQPDATKEGPICMDTWRWMFDCCRIPGLKGEDWSVSYAKPGETGIEGHIIVMRRTGVWKIDVVRDGRLLTTGELEKLFELVYQQADGKEFQSVGILTASDRDTWAKDYKTLTKNYKNKQILVDIHSAAFIVSLDEATPEDPVEFSRELWHGGVDGKGLENRWVDKPVQLIVYDNCKAGVMGEHSVMDGTPMVRLCDDILNDLHRPDFDHGDSPDSLLARPTAEIDIPGDDRESRTFRRLRAELRDAQLTHLPWIVDTHIKPLIEVAKARAGNLVAGQSLGYLLTKYGKKEIKAFGASPDGWAQMIVQLAYARLLRAHPHLQGTAADPSKPVHLPGGTYEAAMTRRFYKGRTEAIRVVSSESRAWVASMDDNSATAEKRRELFAQALKRHGADAREAGAGRGVDRHMLGLRLRVKHDDGEVPLFEDALFKRGSNWVLSTSAIFSPHFPVYGWGEVVPNGFGVAYMTGYDDRLQYTITSRIEMPNADFVREIERAAEDLRDLFTAVDGNKSKL